MKKLLYIVFIWLSVANYIYAESANIDVYFDKNLQVSNVKYTGGQMECGSPINYIANQMDLHPDINYKSYFMVDGPFVKDNYGNWKCYIDENNINYHQTYFNLKNAKIEFDFDGEHETCTIDQRIGTISGYKYIGMISKKNKLVGEYTNTIRSCGDTDENFYYNIDTSLGSTSYKNGGIFIFQSFSTTGTQRKNDITFNKAINDIDTISMEYVDSVVTTYQPFIPQLEIKESSLSNRFIVTFHAGRKKSAVVANYFNQHVKLAINTNHDGNNDKPKELNFAIKTKLKINGNEIIDDIYLAQGRYGLVNDWWIGCASSLCTKNKDELYVHDSKGNGYTIKATSNSFFEIYKTIPKPMINASENKFIFHVKDGVHKISYYDLDYLITYNELAAHPYTLPMFDKDLTLVFMANRNKSAYIANAFRTMVGKNSYLNLHRTPINYYINTPEVKFDELNFLITGKFKINGSELKNDLTIAQGSYLGLNEWWIGAPDGTKQPYCYIQMQTQDNKEYYFLMTNSTNSVNITDQKPICYNPSPLGPDPK